MTDLLAPAASWAGPMRVAASADGRVSISVPDAVQQWLDGGIVTANVGFDLQFEGRQLSAARRDHRQLLSIRLGADEAQIGPRWLPGTTTACAGCAEVRLRQAVAHPLARRGDVNAGPGIGWPIALEELVDVALTHLGGHPLLPGEMLSVGLTRIRRHNVLRSLSCPLCRTRQQALPGQGALPSPPPPLALQSRVSSDAVPVRAGNGATVVDERLKRLVDDRVGPILQVSRDPKAPFAMSAALLPGSRAMGYGRGRNFGRAGSVAILEAYERLGSYPHEGQIIQGLAFDEVRGLAVDPASLGGYSRAQLDHPNCRVMVYGADVPMDWAFGHDLVDGQAWLLPADVAFYGYDYTPRPGQPRRVRFFAESSSGCALGSSLEEAALHALFELIERDAFLLAWGRRVPLPEIERVSVEDDPTTALLLDGIDARGFDVHLLSTTYDLGLPSVWALAVNRSPFAVPATYSAAGSSPVPADAVRGALWELAQLVARPVDWDLDHATRLAEDPTLVDSIEDHVQLYAMPATRDRVMQVLGGPRLNLVEAYPGWPARLCQAAHGDVRDALAFLVGQCRAAGLDQALVVDQSTREHRDLGLAVARVVVPGTLPMCFGAPQQRLGGLPRRRQALHLLDRDADADLLLDPHPFP
ncbi:MAG: TOMM precursor leader peptide-binding protein [Acidimicrobiales bacterium]